MSSLGPSVQHRHSRGVQKRHTALAKSHRAFRAALKHNHATVRTEHRRTAKANGGDEVSPVVSFVETLLSDGRATRGFRFHFAHTKLRGRQQPYPR